MTNDELMKEQMKILDWFSVNMIWFKKYVDADSNTSWGVEDTWMVAEIKALIENRPTVTRKFIDEWAFNLADEAYPPVGARAKYPTWQGFIKTMLQEAGVQIEEGK
jgi:hypothetical protein